MNHAPEELQSIYERGLADFGSLKPNEQHIFVLHDIDLYFEMEGSVADYLISRPSHLSCLVALLQEIEDRASLQLIHRLVGSKEPTEQNQLSAEFYERSEVRWTQLGYPRADVAD